MRLICPSCGAIASLEAWQNDDNWRIFSMLLVKLPKPVEERTLPYLGLFRKGDRGLTPPKARKLLAALFDLVAPGIVQWESSEERPCPPGTWAEAMDATLARRPKALSNHNYLRHVAWELAGPLAARAESDRERERWRGVREDEPPASDEERAEVQRMLQTFTRKFGGGE